MPASTAESRDTPMNDQENRPLEERIAELQETVQTQKGIIENLQEVIKARDMELILLENTANVKEIALQNLYNSRTWKALSGLFQRSIDCCLRAPEDGKWSARYFPSHLFPDWSILMIRYQKGEGVCVTSLGRRPVFVTPQGGRIASDPRLTALWEGIDGQSLEEILDRVRESGESRQETLGALVCLAEAGLIRRDPPRNPRSQEPPSGSGLLVSVIIVGFNSREWLVDCLPSLTRQNYSPLEIIVVDNGSSDDT